MSRNTTSLAGTDLDNLLAELDQIEDPKRASRSIPPPAPREPSPSPFGGNKRDSSSSSSSSSDDEKNNDNYAPPPPPPVSATPRQSSKPGQWDELDALVAKFDDMDSGGGSSAPPAPRDSFRMPSKHIVKMTSDTSTARDSIPPPLPEREDIRKSKRMSVYNAKPSGHSDVCGGCGNPVTGEHILALGKMWHPHHFSCNSCGAGIRGDFYETDGQRTCKSCAENQYRCSKCGGSITGEYYIGNGNMYHPNCLDRHSCAKCGGIITTNSMIALDRHYHVDCFTCTNCGTKLGTSFFNKNGSPHCSNCVGQGGRSGGGSGGGSLNCTKCGGALSGTYVNYEGRNFHNGCFTCSLCNRPLNYESFYTVNGMQACQDCASRR